MVRTTCCLLAGLLVAACSHTTFQYRVSSRERDSLVETLERLELLSSATDASALTAAVDLAGRKALLVFATNALLEKAGDSAGQAREEERSAGSAMMAVALVALDDDQPEDLDRFERGSFDEHWQELSTRINERLVKRFGDAKKGERTRDLLGRAAKAMTGAMSDGYRQGDLDQLREHHFDQCHFDGDIVSYRAGLMRYKSWGMAEWSKTFQAWKERLERLHFVRVACPSETALFIMAQYEDAPTPMALMWRFFTPDQWSQVSKGLERMFAL